MLRIIKVINESLSLKSEKRLFKSKYIPREELIKRLKELKNLKSEFNGLGAEEKVIFNENQISLFDDYLEYIANLKSLSPISTNVLGAGVIPFHVYRRGELNFSFWNEKIPYWLSITVSNIPQKRIQ